MSLAIHGNTTQSEPGLGVGHALVYGALFPIFLASEGLRRVRARAADDERNEPSAGQTAWLAEARSGAKIATSYVLMARSMLQTSERRPRPVRPS